MPNNISDFANQINTRSCPSGAIYSTALNSDGSLKDLPRRVGERAPTWASLRRACDLRCGR